MQSKTALVRHRKTGGLYAMKCIFHDSQSLKSIKKKYSSFNYRDIKSPYILSIENEFWENNTFFVVTEYCDKGDLASRIEDCIEDDNHFEEDVFFIFY
jgi:serine/threonine protein kinase